MILVAVPQKTVITLVITMEDTNLSDLTHEAEDNGDVILCCALINA